MTDFNVKVTSRFERDYSTLNIETKKSLTEHIQLLQSNPYLGKRLHGELKGKLSLRIGDYRLIYMIDEKERVVYLLTIRHRKHVYNS
ncbi:type II toxin-antitoxin system RelE family toxin [Candidatus Nitrosocaldus islandicus]|uniref:type II toxin-antitoxin system RelE family toxin n=1 Tax=Candidatus Nitrosocaldus islandicus TaxID=2045011 RepID=UPI000CD10F0F|nr:type II toxin-antitoxin system RelE/ParE family toxin [Candidatus Nitrosocaldus islandicus]